MERSEHKIVCKLKCQQRHISLIPVEVQYLAVQNASLFLIRTGNASVEQNIRVILSLKKKKMGSLSAQTVWGCYKTNTQITLQVSLGIPMADLTFSF